MATGATLVSPHPAAVERHERVAAAEARIAEFMGVINAGTGALVETIAEVLVDDLWAEAAGIRSPEHWVSWQCGVSPARAQALVAMARRITELPATAEAFRAGELTEDQVRVITRHTPPEREAEVLEKARGMLVTQLTRILRTVPPPKPADGVEPEPTRTREVMFGNFDDGWWWGRMVLPPDEGAAMQKSWEAGRDTEFAERHPDEADDFGLPRRRDVSWADGALRAADAAVAGLASLMGRDAGDRYQVLLHVDLTQPDRPAHLHLGPSLPEEVRRFVECDCTLSLIFEKAGLPVGQGRRKHTVNHRLRTLIEERDRGCRVPGCTQARWLHIHHMVHWEDGGPTDPDNLVALCPFHHRLHHLGLLDITGDPQRLEGLEFTDRKTMRAIKPVPPRPPGGPPLEAARDVGLTPSRFEHPTGEPVYWWNWN